MTKDDTIAFCKFVLKRYDIDIRPDWIYLYDEFIKSSIPKSYGMVYINWKVASYFELDPDDLLSKTRKREIVRPRQIAMYFMRKFGHTNKRIVQFYGLKEASTAFSSEKTVRDLMDTDGLFKKFVNDISQELGLS